MSREISDLVKAAKTALDALQDSCGKVAPEGKALPCGNPEEEPSPESGYDFGCHDHGCLKAIRELRFALYGFYERKDLYRDVPDEKAKQ